MGVRYCTTDPTAAAHRKRCEVLHRGFLKRCAGVAKATPDDIVYGEFGRTPLQVFWEEMTARYLERLEAAGGLLSCAYQESLALHGAGQPPWAGWAQQHEAAAQPWEAGWLQRLCSSQVGSKLNAYSAFKTDWGLETYLSTTDMPRQHRVALARLWMGSHWLGTQLGTYARAAERQRERKINCVKCSFTHPYADNPMLLCDQCNAGCHLRCLDTAHALHAPRGFLVLSVVCSSRWLYSHYSGCPKCEDSVC